MANEINRFFQGYNNVPNTNRPVATNVAPSIKPALSPNKVKTLGNLVAETSNRTLDLIRDNRSNRDVNMQELINKRDTLPFPFRNLSKDSLEAIDLAAKSSKNPTPIGSALQALNMVSEMIEKDEPLVESNFADSLNVFDDILNTELKAMKSTANFVQGNMAVRDIIKPVSEKMSQFAGNMLGAVGPVDSNEAFSKVYDETYGNMENVVAENKKV